MESLLVKLVHVQKTYPFYSCEQVLQDNNIPVVEQDEFVTSFDEPSNDELINNLGNNDYSDEHIMLNQNISNNIDLSYQSLHNMCKQYLKLINRDKNKMSSFYTTIDGLIYCASRNLSTETTFATIIKKSSDHINQPLKGTMVYNTSKKRYNSRHETHTGYKKSKPSKMSKHLFSGNDFDHVDHNNKTKSCTFCKCTGHKRYNCPIKKGYGSEIEQTAEAKKEFCTRLRCNNYFKTTHILSNKTTSRTVPKGIRGVVIEAKISPSVVLCSFIINGGDKHSIYNNYPFEIDEIGNYAFNAVSSRCIISNLEVNQLHHQNTTDVRAFMPSFSQQLQHTFLQSNFTAIQVDQEDYNKFSMFSQLSNASEFMSNKHSNV